MVRLPRARLAAACASIALLVVTAVLWPRPQPARLVVQAVAASTPVPAAAPAPAEPPVDYAALAAAPTPSTTSTTAPRRSSTAPARHAVRPVTASNAVDPAVGPSDADFDRLARCESGGRWALDSGNGFYGGLQFTVGTWRSYGGDGMPNQSPRETQIAVARRVWRAEGWHPWPSCSRTVGLA